MKLTQAEAVVGHRLSIRKSDVRDAVLYPCLSM
jgi:hypothetical protein